jgi:hypothetical protein
MSNANNSTKSYLSAADYKQICNDVQSRVQNGERITLVNLAKQHGVSPSEMRKILVDEFNNRISFMRGRTGGIRII